MSVTAPPVAPASPASAPPPLGPSGLEASAREAATAPARAPDQVVLSPGALLLQLLATPSTALRQLVTLLGVIEGAAGADRDPAPVPLGHLASAVEEAARQVGAGYEAILSKTVPDVPVGREPPAFASTAGTGARQVGGGSGAEPMPAAFTAAGTERSASTSTVRAGGRQAGAGYSATPAQASSNVPAGSEHPGFESIEHWRGEAKATLRDAADLLEHVEHRLREPAPLVAGDSEPAQSPSPFAGAEALWALGQVFTAQRRVTWALRGLEASRTAREGRPRGLIWIGRPGREAALAGSTALLGALLGAALLALLLGLAVGGWLVLAGVIGVLATVAAWVGWGWRLAFTWRGLRIELRR